MIFISNNNTCWHWPNWYNFVFLNKKGAAVVALGEVVSKLFTKTPVFKYLIKLNLNSRVKLKYEEVGDPL